MRWTRGGKEGAKSDLSGLGLEKSLNAIPFIGAPRE